MLMMDSQIVPREKSMKNDDPSVGKNEAKLGKTPLLQYNLFCIPFSSNFTHWNFICAMQACVYIGSL